MTSDVVTDPGWPAQRAAVLRAGISVGLATGAVGLSFGAVSVASGLSVWQTCALSLVMFTGGSQFALVGVLGVGGGAVAAVSTAALLGSRNAFYALRLAALLRVRGVRRLLAAQLVIDESTAVAIGQASDRGGPAGFLDHRPGRVRPVEPGHRARRARRRSRDRPARPRPRRRRAGRVPGPADAAVARPRSRGWSPWSRPWSRWRPCRWYRSEYRYCWPGWSPWSACAVRAVRSP